ncbi:3-keto-disaccharide hydrolase [Nocardioides panzhihuensis]|uniref:3-keto-alpha-glucoside-1,2-lyase/3-keto-2-hydroxy-glucal hydratase domain-containing protein n=1 Tax=Nocardioides panzhihuensis TaxID=860243 RepID=A0A7Z0DM63_9ACTN|nr:DUF1080 domain-containing protein [Nocardioides panzhihuensis]NYI78190.1 hypothetical protein [Nocardioides panzhihuensis]
MSHSLPSRRTRTRLAVGSAVLGITALCLGGPIGAASATPAGAPSTTMTCAAPDARSSVVFLDLDSGVANSTLSSGCTINDVIDDERTWPTHGAFVTHVRSVTAELVATGEVTRAEASRLQSAAARSQVGKVEGYDWLFDGSADSFDDWAYAGDGGFDLVSDGTIRSRAGAGGGFGTLWYPEKEYGDFSLRLQFRDDAPGVTRGNSGVQVRFPELWGPVEGCPTTFNGGETGNLSWIAVNCGHEIQVNDSPEGGSNDPRKTGSIYGFADLDLAQARPTPKGTWNELEIRVVGQQYTVIRNGVVINEFENLPGLPFPGRPNDPDSSSRGLTGHVGIQAHGSTPDVVSYRNVRIRELS